MDIAKNIAGKPSDEGFTRRSFLLGLGATAAVVASSGLAGCAPQASNAASGSAGNSNIESGSSDPSVKANTVQAVAETPAKTQEVKEADLVVIGSGIAGMSAAVEATLAGASVIVLEKHTATGGDSSICTGNFYCCGSKKQDDMGYSDYGTPRISHSSYSSSLTAMRIWTSAAWWRKTAVRPWTGS